MELSQRLYVTMRQELAQAARALRDELAALEDQADVDNEAWQSRYEELETLVESNQAKREALEHRWMTRSTRGL